jgi:arylsulfatase A
MKNLSLYLALLLGCAFSIGSSMADAATRPPNIVFFLVDDQGYGDLGSHGNKLVQTPNMDAFARQAVELSHFYVTPVCAPTRCSLMTGQYNFRAGVTDVFSPGYTMKTGEVTIADVLHAAGYATGMYGKWHLGDAAPARPIDHGFQETLSFNGACLLNYFDPVLLYDGKEKQYSGYCMNIFADNAVSFIRRNKDRPFFLYLPSNLIHSPLQPVESLAQKFRLLGLDDETSKVWAMLESVDLAFGQVLATLKELGLDDNTIVFLTSDNGPCKDSTTAERFMCDLRGLKGTVYENGIRVPSFMRWPGHLPAGTKADGITSALDIMPTLLAATGVPAPAGDHLDGINLLPHLSHPAAPVPDRTLVFQWDGHLVPVRDSAYAVRSGRYKLVQANGMAQKGIREKYAELCRLEGRGPLTIDGPPRYELFDIAADPGERTDIAAQKPELVAQLKQVYENWFDDTWASWHSSAEAPSSTPQPIPTATPNTQGEL